MKLKLLYDDRWNDTDEQAQFLNELHAQMFVVAYAKVRNKADAHDIVQDSWLKIYSKLHTLKDPDKLVVWAKTIAANTAKNVIRRKASKRTASLPEYLHVGDRRGQVEESVEKRVLYEAVNTHLSRFDEQTRAMFRCKYFFGMSDTQTARKLGLPAGTIKARIHRVKHKLRAMLRTDETR